jgi:hypothetical protein
MIRGTNISKLECFILYFAFVLANLRALIFIFLFPDTSTLLGPAWIEILLWALAAAIVLYLLLRDSQQAEFFAMWRRNWLPALSFSWHSFPSSGPLDQRCHFVQVFGIVVCTLIASYFGMRLQARGE